MTRNKSNKSKNKRQKREVAKQPSPPVNQAGVRTDTSDLTASEHPPVRYMGQYDLKVYRLNEYQYQTLKGSGIAELVLNIALVALSIFITSIPPAFVFDGEGSADEREMYRIIAVTTGVLGLACLVVAIYLKSSRHKVVKQVESCASIPDVQGLPTTNNKKGE